MYKYTTIIMLNVSGVGDQKKFLTFQAMGFCLEVNKKIHSLR